MAQVFFHVEVEEDVLEDEWDEREVSTHGRRHDGALVCSFRTNNLARVRRIIRDNGITEDNDQVTAGVEYVIVRDFEIRD